MRTRQPRQVAQKGRDARRDRTNAEASSTRDLLPGARPIGASTAKRSSARGRNQTDRPFSATCYGAAVVGACSVVSTTATSGHERALVRTSRKRKCPFAA